MAKISYRALDVIFRDLEDIVIIKNIRCNEILILEDVSADIWRFLANNVNVEFTEIVSYISEEYCISQNEIVDDIDGFIMELYDSGVVLIDGKYIDTAFCEVNTQINTDNDFEGQIIKIYQDKGLIYSVTIELTYSCNEKCVHCYANYPSESNRKNLTIAQIKAMLFDLYHMKCMHITFTGGDPFMFADFVELFEFTRNLGFSCDIFTNAVYLSEHNDILQRILDYRPQAFFISLYGADSKTHENITNTPGTFDKTVTSIRKIRKANVPVVLNVMVLNLNADKIEEIVSFAKELNVDYRVGISLIHKNDGSDLPMEYFIDDKTIIKKILLIEKDRFFSLDQHIGTEKGDFFCGAARTSLAISPDGTVYPCVSLKCALGSIFEDRIADIWCSDKRKNLLSLLTWDNAVKCKDCNYVDNCPHCIGISLLETGDMFSCNTCDRVLAECLYEIGF